MEPVSRSGRPGPGPPAGSPGGRSATCLPSWPHDAGSGWLTRSAGGPGQASRGQLQDRAAMRLPRAACNLGRQDIPALGGPMTGPEHYRQARSKSPGPQGAPDGGTSLTARRRRSPPKPRRTPPSRWPRRPRCTPSLTAGRELRSLAPACRAAARGSTSSPQGFLPAHQSRAHARRRQAEPPAGKPSAAAGASCGPSRAATQPRPTPPARAAAAPSPGYPTGRQAAPDPG